eukprot:1528069-Pleurochrysis_carterae.AAC.1
MCFAPPGRSCPNSFIAIGILRWLPTTYGDSAVSCANVSGFLLVVNKPLCCVMSLKWLAQSFAFNRVSLYMEGSVSQSISFRSSAYCSKPQRMK